MSNVSLSSCLNLYGKLDLNVEYRRLSDRQNSRIRISPGPYDCIAALQGAEGFSRFKSLYDHSSMMELNESNEGIHIHKFRWQLLRQETQVKFNCIITCV